MTLLFGLTSLLCFAPMAQQNLKLFKFTRLYGYKEPTPKPVFDYGQYKCGNYQKGAEQYLQENFGFCEPLIRMYNQSVYDLFKTTSNRNVAIERDGWLYLTEYIHQYFGTIEKESELSYSQVRDNLATQAKSLYKVNAILNEYGVHVLSFTLPTKSYVYPEHLRWHPLGDTTFNAAVFWEQQLASYGVPHINMTPWFQQMQDTCSFDLFYSKDCHWASGATLAVDSILRYMERLGGQPLTRLRIGAPYPVDTVPDKEIDLEKLLNLARPLPHEPLYEFPISYVTDENTRFPTVWFVGTSFYWRMTRRVNFCTLFRSRDFQFYESYYHYNRESAFKSTDDIDPLRELLMHDYIVLFRDGPQLYFYGFWCPSQWLINLCVNDEKVLAKTESVADSIMLAWKAQTHDDSIRSLKHAQMLLKQHPEWFEELRGDGIPTTRNKRIKQLLVEKQICSDRTGRFLFQANLQNDSSLLNDRTGNVFYTTYDYFAFLVDEAVNEICRTSSVPVTISNNNLLLNETFISQAIDTIGKRIRLHIYDDDSLMWRACATDKSITYFDHEEGLALLRQKASSRHISIDKAFREDAVWMVNQKKDLGQYVNEDVLLEAFENYQVERKLRKNPKSMDNILAKHQQMDKPLRIIMNQDIKWIRTTKQ